MLHLKLDDTLIKQKLQHLPGVVEKAARGAIKNTLAFDVAGPKGTDTLANYMDRTMKQYIDRPTPFTANGSGLAFYAKVPDSGPVFGKFGVKRNQAAYLQFIAKGTPRDNKIIERRAPDGKLMVPSRKMKLDKHGNVPKAVYEYIYKQAFLSSTEGNQFFYLKERRGKLPPGIYRRNRTGGAQLEFLAVSSAKYSKRWDFFGLAQAWINTRLPVAINDAIAFRLKKGI